MRKLAVLLAVIMVSGAAVAKAGELENSQNSLNFSLNDLQNSLDGLVKDFHGGPKPPKPGHPGQPGWNPGHPQPPMPPQPGHPGWNPGHPQPPITPHPSPVYPPYNPGYPGQPGHPGWNPNPFPPPNPFPHPGPYPSPWPNPYPNPGWNQERVRFDSGRFDWASDARKSLENATDALRRNRIDVLEKRLDYDRYTLVFETRRYARVERYDSQYYTWTGDAERAANDMARMYESRGLIILEKNIHRNSFTLSYFDPR